MNIVEVLNSVKDIFKKNSLEYFSSTSAHLLEVWANCWRPDRILATGPSKGVSSRDSTALADPDCAAPSDSSSYISSVSSIMADKSPYLMQQHDLLASANCMPRCWMTTLTRRYSSSSSSFLTICFLCSDTSAFLPDFSFPAMKEEVRKILFFTSLSTA